MKAVLDNNVFISGIHWKGVCEKILRAWVLGEFQIITSKSIVEEFVCVLVCFKIQLTAEVIEDWKILLLKKAVLVEPKESITLVKEDAEDNKFIEAAISGDVDFIISQDKHLLDIREFRKIKIINPEEFLKILIGKNY